MENWQDAREEQEYKATAYGLLARIFRKEVDREFYDALAALVADDATANDSSPFSQGLVQMQSYFVDPGLNPLKDLAVDYARVIIGAGVSDGSAAYPYESVYTSPDHLVMQQARDDVMAVYRQWGLGRILETVEPEDHITFELEFMMFLAQKGAQAAANKDAEGLAQAQEAQAQFLSDHLLRWTPAFCADVERYSKTAFYKAAALMTKEFLESESTQEKVAQ